MVTEGNLTYFDFISFVEIPSLPSLYLMNALMTSLANMSARTKKTAFTRSFDGLQELIAIGGFRQETEFPRCWRTAPSGDGECIVEQF